MAAHAVADEILNHTTPLPVTILTGFLGAGKTTLINYLLEHNQGERIAIIENEFGAVNVDGALLKSTEDVEIVELSNGCVCCSFRSFLMYDSISSGYIEPYDSDSATPRTAMPKFEYSHSWTSQDSRVRCTCRTISSRLNAVRGFLHFIAFRSIGA